MKTGRLILFNLLLLGLTFVLEGLILLWMPLIENALSSVCLGSAFLMIYFFLRICYTKEENHRHGGKL